MKFSDYLRTLDEGNLGHELEKQEAAKPKVGKNLQKVSDMTQSPEEQADDSAKRSDWKSSLRPTGDDGGAKAARDKVQLDWQIPSLHEVGKSFGQKEDEHNLTDPRGDEGDVPDKPVNTKRWDGHGKEPEGYEDAGGPIGSDGTAELRKKTVKRESLEIPMRDALGRLSIYSMQEASTPKPMRRALKKANMGKDLSNKESGNVMNNPKADPSTRTNAAEKYKNPQDDIDANDAAEGERRENAAGMDRQSHLDK